MKSKHCKVCGQYFSRRRMVCLACETFYKRNKDKAGGLRCESGTRNCHRDTAVSVWNGATWRFMCKYCRFQKCKPYFDENDNCLFDIGPVDQLGQMEEDLKKAISASQTVRQHLNALPLWTATDGSPDVNQFKQSVAQHFDTMGLKVVEFFKSLQHFKSLSLHDRVTILPRSFFRICIAESVYQKCQPMLFGMNASNAHIFLSIFPEANMTIPHQNYLSTLFQQWNPSQSEFALFLNLLFFHDSTAGDLDNLLEDKATIVDIRHKNQRLVHSLLCKQAGGDSAKANERLKLMTNAAELIAGFATKRRHFFSLFALNNPDMNQSSVMLKNFTRND